MTVPDTAVTRTPLLKFAAKAPFRFRQHNTGENALQTGRGGETFYTTSEQFANRVVVATPKQFRVIETRATLPSLPRSDWPTYDFTGKRALFLLPSQALGSNVATLLFLQALREKFSMGGLGVFCARSAADIYLTDPQTTVFPLWIGERELRRWDVVVDLGHLESRRDIDIWPVDMEADLLEAFNVAPSRRYGVEGKALPADRPPVIGILPLASSPLRTLPIAATRALCEALAERGRVVLCLNKDQHQGVLYAREIGGLPAGVEILDGFASIGALLSAIDGFDYGVFADSGPAHMSKLFATPGVAVYSSAPGDVLQGRFRNLANWTIPFVGPHCATPCGLAKLRATPAGRIGCMGSLEVPIEGLPSIARGANPQVVERLLLAEPVPCIAALRDRPEGLTSFVLEDLARRAT